MSPIDHSPLPETVVATSIAVTTVVTVSMSCLCCVGLKV